jgi:hypothetical protein
MTHTLAYGFFDYALWLAGLGHFVILIASFQVPGRSFTVLTIVAFGVLILTLHCEFLSGDRAAIGLAVFIAIYWAARVLVDIFYFSHSDWPRGRVFVVGHILLTSLFTSLVAIFAALIVWHLLFKA